MDDLIVYIRLMRKRLEGISNIDLIMEEISNMASNNWIKTGVPNLTNEQLNKVILRVISRGTTLN